MIQPPGPAREPTGGMDSSRVVDEADGFDIRRKVMLRATIEKVRDGTCERRALGCGDGHTGFLISYPAVGSRIELFCERPARRIRTSPVRSVWRGPAVHTLSVETENSRYRVTIHTSSDRPDGG